MFVLSSHLDPIGDQNDVYQIGVGLLVCLKVHVGYCIRTYLLAEAVLDAANGKPVIVVLNVGSPKELPWLDDRVSAVLLAPFG